MQAVQDIAVQSSITDQSALHTSPRFFISSFRMGVQPGRCLWTYSPSRSGIGGITSTPSATVCGERSWRMVAVSMPSKPSFSREGMLAEDVRSIRLAFSDRFYFRDARRFGRGFTSLK